MRANVTKVRVTALSISSTHMNITSGFRRTSNPTAPIENRIEPSTRYQAGVTSATASITRPPRASRGRRLGARRLGSAAAATSSGSSTSSARFTFRAITTAPTTAITSSTLVASKAKR